MRRVGLNLLYLVPREVGGTEIYARRLVRALAELRPGTEWTAFCGREAAPSLRGAGWPGNVRVHEIPVDARDKPARIAAEMTLLPAAARRARVDLLHSLGTTSPLAGVRPRVVTVHDLIYEHFPQTFPTPARLGLKALVGPAARRCDRVLADSHATKRDVVERLRVPAERVDVVPLGLGEPPGAAPTPEAELRERFALGDHPVVLCVSAALEHKNLTRLIAALPALRVPRPPVLVIAGHPGRERDRLLALAAEHGVADRVRLTGWLGQEDLEGLYAAAACCAYPSLLEGFGLPVLEAMRRGVPLACADATALPEVAGNAAELFDPRDTRAIAAAVARLLTDPAHAAELVARGRERAAGFTWEACARATLASYGRALRGG